MYIHYEDLIAMYKLDVVTRRVQTQLRRVQNGGLTAAQSALILIITYLNFDIPLQFSIQFIVLLF